MSFSAIIFSTRRLTFAAVGLLLAGVAVSASAQQFILPSLTQEQMFRSFSHIPADASSNLPDAPSALIATDSSSSAESAPEASQQTVGEHIAPLHTYNIRPGWQASSLSSHDKLMMSFEEMYDWSSLAGYVVAGAYSHITNGQPNYGTDNGAFAQRIGAAALRGASEDFFADGVFASAFHEDPRYYIEGDRYSFGHRLLYAATRPLVTRSDSGHARINASLLLGYFAASALTAAYYPQQNRNATDIGRTYGSSLGGAAAGFVWAEFIGDVLDLMHHRQ